MSESETETPAPDATENETASEAGTQLRQRIEAQAGAAFEGPDARGLHFTFDRENNYTLNYLTIIMDGFSSPEQASTEMARFALTHPFDVLGNPVHLRRSTEMAPAGYPQGAILMWRGGHTPLFGEDAEHIWSVQMTYCLLPPFAHVVG